MGTLGLEATLAGRVADGVDLAVVTGVLEATLSLDTIGLERGDEEIEKSVKWK